MQIGIFPSDGSGWMERQMQEKQQEICEEIWNLTRDKLAERYPFFRAFFWHYTFQAQGSILKMGTDGTTIFYEPEYLIENCRDGGQSLEHDFLHMFYHTLFLHLVRKPHEQFRLWNLACDIAVERLIAGEKEEIIPEKIYEELGEKLLAEEELLVLERKYHRDDHSLWRRAEQKRLMESVESLWSGLSKANGSGSGGYSGGIGSMAGNKQEEMTIQKRNQYDFRKFLKRFAVTQEEVKTDTESFDYILYLYGLEHYGNMPLIEHLEYQEINKLEELVIAIDTSGSCKTETVRRFMEETYGILSDRENFFKKMNVYILQCDFCIQDAVHITCEEEWKEYLEHLTIKGRSGTNFRPVFEYVEELRRKRELKNLKGLLYFTDGDGIYPQKATDYGTAFVFYQEKSRHQQVPAWAVKLVLDEEFDEH